MAVLWGKSGELAYIFVTCHKNIREIGAFCTAGVALGEAGFCGFATEVLEAKALPDGGGGKRIFFADVHDSWSVSQKKFELPIKNRKILLAFILRCAHVKWERLYSVFGDYCRVRVEARWGAMVAAASCSCCAVTAVMRWAASSREPTRP